MSRTTAHRRRRPAGFDWRAALATPSFTPAVRDLPELLALLDGDDEMVAKSVGRALDRMGTAAIPLLLAELDVARPPRKPRLVRWLGGHVDARGRWCDRTATVVEAGDDALVLLGALLHDPDAKTRRAAIAALARADERAEVEGMLIPLWESRRDPAELRVLAAALGKCGGARSLHVLDDQAAGDRELARIVEQARLLLRRRLTRTVPSEIREEVQPKGALPLHLHCRLGLSELLCAELGVSWRARILSPTTVAVTLAAPLAEVLRARLWLGLGFPLVRAPSCAGKELGDVLESALATPMAAAILSAFTAGQVRYRIAWHGPGQHHGALRQAAARLSARFPEWINDSSARAWDLVVRPEAGRLHVELAPRLHDRRFAYRVRDVPAASHPTVAAALARVAGVRADDVVWDPFVGSGSELIERARRGPVRALIGSDHDPQALLAARANLAAAGVTAVLVETDAFSHAPAGVSLILTNPPMGRRVRTSDLDAFLRRFLEHAARVLGADGRMVWISPRPERTREQARAVGLVAEYTQEIDMGGFTAVIERLVRPRQTLR